MYICRTVRLHIIELKKLLKPLNEFGSEDPKELRGFLFNTILK